MQTRYTPNKICMQGAGLGIWLSETPAQIKSWRGWIWGRFRQQQDVILAKFPLHTAITTSFIISQPGNASLLLSAMHDKGQLQMTVSNV